MCSTCTSTLAVLLLEGDDWFVLEEGFGGDCPARFLLVDLLLTLVVVVVVTPVCKRC